MDLRKPPRTSSIEVHHFRVTIPSRTDKGSENPSVSGFPQLSRSSSGTTPVDSVSFRSPGRTPGDLPTTISGVFRVEGGVPIVGNLGAFVTYKKRVKEVSVTVRNSV